MSERSGSSMRAVRIMARISELGLIVLLGLLVARTVWFLAFGASMLDLAQPNPRVDRMAGNAVAVFYDVSRLYESQLFSSDIGDQEVLIVRETIPETQLNIVLRGVRAGDDPETGVAFIQTSDGRDRIVRPGETVTDGVSLHSVEPDRIVLRRQGVLEALVLRERPGTSQLAATAPTAASVTQAARRYAGAPSDLFQVEPVFEYGALVGYRMAGSSDAALGAVGLRADDLLLAVDGEALADAEDVADVFEALQGRESLSLSILRGGVPLTVQVDLP